MAEDQKDDRQREEMEVGRLGQLLEGLGLPEGLIRAEVMLRDA